MSTYKIWLPYQLVSLETKQRQQPTKEKHLTHLTQNHQSKKPRKTNKKEPKLSEIIKKHHINILVQNVNIKVWRKLSSHHREPARATQL